MLWYQSRVQDAAGGHIRSGGLQKPSCASHCQPSARDTSPERYLLSCSAQPASTCSNLCGGREPTLPCLVGYCGACAWLRAAPPLLAWPGWLLRRRRLMGCCPRTSCSATGLIVPASSCHGLAQLRHHLRAVRGCLGWAAGWAARRRRQKDPRSARRPAPLQHSPSTGSSGHQVTGK